MKGIIKWLFIIGGSFLVIIIAAVLIVPHFIDVQKYKPMIEQKVSQATGRPFTLGGKIDLSVFPWVGVKLTDIHLGNPAGFGKKDMVDVKNFEVRLKVMPLLSKKIEVKTFVLDSPEIYLEKLKNGHVNWQMMTKEQGETKVKKQENKKEKSSSVSKLPIKALLVNNFSITNGELTYVDQKTNFKKEISDINLTLKDISLVKPIKIAFGARLDGQPVSLDGNLGPIGKNPGRGTMAFDFVLKALKQLEVKLKGDLIDPLVSGQINLELTVSSFSPRKLMAALNQKLPFETNDPKVLDAMSLKTQIKGNLNKVSLSNGEMILDNSKLTFSASAKEFFRPNLKFNLKLDGIDLDRYLPKPVTKGKQSQRDKAGSTSSKKAGSAKKKTDYGPLRKLVLDGKIKLGKLKAHGAIIENVNLHILAKNGIITIDPLDMNLYHGNIASNIEVNVQKNDPRTKINLDASGIQAGPLMKDTMKKDIIEGSLKTNLLLSMTGDTPDMIKQTLTGQGTLLFTDGALIGIDLTNLVQNLKAKFGMAERSTKKPRTDFAEFKIPFTVKNGLINTGGTSMISPLFRVIATGSANLVKELLDLRVEPKFVATLKGQGDVTKRSGFEIPVIITGKFSSPKIRPDLKGMLKSKGTSMDLEGLKKQVLGTKKGQQKAIDDEKKDLEKQVKGLLKGFIN